MSLKIAQRKHVPRYTITGDGLPGDPVNVALTVRSRSCARPSRPSAGRGGPAQLQELDRDGPILRLQQALSDRAVQHPLSLGRGQDIGFQKAIDDSPRKRHHVRFWALALGDARSTLGTAGFWLNTDRPPDGDRVLWVGAGTRDTGFGLTKLTFQITHATDADTNAEREFVFGELEKGGVIADVRSYRAGDQLVTEHVNRYVTDGDVAVADLGSQ